MKVHHNTLKKAKAHGIVLTVEDNEIVASKDGVRLAAGLAGNVVLEQAIVKLGGEAPKAKASKEPKAPKEPKPAKAKKVSAYEQAARDEGWTGRGGAFKNAEQESESDA